MLGNPLPRRKQGLRRLARTYYPVAIIAKRVLLFLTVGQARPPESSSV